MLPEMSQVTSINLHNAFWTLHVLAVEQLPHCTLNPALKVSLALNQTHNAISHALRVIDDPIGVGRSSGDCLRALQFDGRQGRGNPNCLISYPLVLLLYERSDGNSICRGRGRPQSRPSKDRFPPLDDFWRGQQLERAEPAWVGWVGEASAH